MMYMNIFIYDSLTGLTIYQRSSDILSGRPFVRTALDVLSGPTELKWPKSLYICGSRSRPKESYVVKG